MKKEDLLKLIKTQVYQQLDMTQELADDELIQVIQTCVNQESKNVMIPLRDRENIVQEIYNAIRKMDVLQELLEDDEVTEIMINGCHQIFLEKQGKIRRWNKTFESEEKLEDIAQKIAALSNRIVNASSPILDTRLSDGSRVNIVLPPIAIDGATITIRKFYEVPLTMEKLIALESLTQEAANFLKRAVQARYNLFISGATGSGKTTFLNVLSNYIPKDERVITIEDSAELQIKNVDNLVRLESRNANVEGKNAVTIRDLIRASLRMRPDRIVVGEVRGAETLDMVQAMCTGHDGSLSTGHGNGPKDMMARLETMILMGIDMPIAAIRQQLVSGVDILIHLGRLRDKSRRVLQIVEVVGLEQGEIVLQPIFSFQETGEKNGRVQGELVREAKKLVHMEKMEAAGIVWDD